MKLLIRNVYYALLAAWLTACTTIPAPTPTPPNHAAYQAHLAKLANIEHFNIKGRLSANTQKQGFSGGIIWQHQTAADNIAIFSPLGGQVAEIKQDETGVTLTDTKGNSITANDAESLTEQTMGWRLPLSGLTDWALGKPAKGAVELATWDAQGKLTRLKQHGWDIEYMSYQEADGYVLPGKIFMRSEQVNLKLLVEKWGLVAD